MKNTVPTSIPALVAASYKAAAGATLHGTALPLLQNTPAKINADLTALVDSIMAHNGGKAELSTRRDANRAKIDESRTFLSVGRDNLKPTLGTEYNQSWDNTGLVGSLAIPRTTDEIVPVLLTFKGYLIANPALEVSTLITATRAQALFDELNTTVNAVTEQEGIVADLIEARDEKAGKMSKRLSALIQELRMQMDVLDNRWLQFGFNKPGAQETPEAPLHVSAVLIGPTAAAVKWNAAERAEYYRVFKKVNGVDNDYVAAGSPADLDFALENLPANSTIDIVVTAVNNGGESPVSEKITIVTH